jgi:hypothetical protein
MTHKPRFHFPWFLSGLCPFAFYLPFYLSNSVEPYLVCGQVCTLIMHSMFMFGYGYACVYYYLP